MVIWIVQFWLLSLVITTKAPIGNATEAFAGMVMACDAVVPER